MQLRQLRGTTCATPSCDFRTVTPPVSVIAHSSWPSRLCLQRLSQKFFSLPRSIVSLIPGKGVQIGSLSPICVRYAADQEQTHGARTQEVTTKTAFTVAVE